MNTKERKLNIILSLIVGLILLLHLIPIYYLLIATFKSGKELAEAPLALPKAISFDRYVVAFYDMQYPKAFKNTFLIAAGTVVLNLSLSTMAAYSLARYKTKLNSFIFMIFVAGMMIPVQMGLSSLYKLVSALKLVDNLLSVILINAAAGSITSIFLIKSFIASSIPYEIEESARIDGCSIFGIFFRIVVPLLKPVLATLSIIILLGAWNDYMNPLLFLHSRENNVILQELNRNIGQFSVDWTSMFPMLVLGILPLTIFYILLQNFIISGVTAGAVKG
ncbi:MAG: carbohydrate ABC transporter permease [Eubacteriales bacterium]|nr:carbohydrate ABC transporter permease [Eubacteriales bacterium]